MIFFIYNFRQAGYSCCIRQQLYVVFSNSEPMFPVINNDGIIKTVDMIGSSNNLCRPLQALYILNRVSTVRIRIIGILNQNFRTQISSGGSPFELVVVLHSLIGNLFPPVPNSW